MMSPTGGSTGSGNAELTRQLVNWWHTHRRGRVYDCNTGFYLPDGSMLCPDGAYVTQEKLERYTRRDHKSFPRVCPDFVVELRSESDTLKSLREKMRLWIVNGAALGWFIDPDDRSVSVYTTADGTYETVRGKLVVGKGPVAGFTLDLDDIWEFYPY